MFFGGFFVLRFAFGAGLQRCRSRRVKCFFAGRGERNSRCRPGDSPRAARCRQVDFASVLGVATLRKPEHLNVAFVRAVPTYAFGAVAFSVLDAGLEAARAGSLNVAFGKAPAFASFFAAPESWREKKQKSPGADQKQEPTIWQLPVASATIEKGVSDSASSGSGIPGVRSGWPRGYGAIPQQSNIPIAWWRRLTTIW